MLLFPLIFLVAYAFIFYPDPLCDEMFDDAWTEEEQEKCEKDEENAETVMPMLGLITVAVTFPSLLMFLRVQSKSDIRKGKGDYDPDDEYEDDYDSGYQSFRREMGSSTHQPQPLRSFSPPPQRSFSPPPDRRLQGEWSDDGYEWIESPEGSGAWWWRDPNTGQWVRDNR